MPVEQSLNKIQNRLWLYECSCRHVWKKPQSMRMVYPNWAMLQKNLFNAFLECKVNEELAYVLLHSFFCYTSQVLIWTSSMWQQVTPHSSTELISSQSQIQQTWTIEPRLKKGMLNTIAPTNVKGQAHLSWAYTLIKAPPAFQPITKRYCRTKTGWVKWAPYWGIPAQHKNSSNQSKYLHHQQSQSSACSVLPVLIRNSRFL